MSQITEHSEVIDGKTFVVYKLPPLDSNDLLIDILRALLPMAGSVAGGTKAKGDSLLDLDIDADAMAGGVSALVAALDKPTIRNMISTLEGVSTVDGQKLKDQFPIVFRDDISSMYVWLWFALKVQYSGFFARWTNEKGGSLVDVLRAALFPQASPESGS